MNFEQAYNFLNIHKEASKDEIIKRYDLLLKKYKQGASLNAADGSNITIENVNEAYSILMGQVSIEPKTKQSIKNEYIWNKIGIDPYKASNFIHYYKFHMLGIVALIAFIIYLGVSCASYQKPDINIGIIGDIYISDIEQMKVKLNKEVLKTKVISINSTTYNENTDAQYKSAMLQKEMLMFAAEDIDLYIIDKKTFEKFGTQGAFLDLDNIKEINKTKKYLEAKLSLKVIDKSANKKTYGVDLTKSKLNDKKVFAGKEIIAAIGVRVKNMKNVTEIINKYLGG